MKAFIFYIIFYRYFGFCVLFAVCNVSKDDFFFPKKEQIRGLCLTALTPSSWIFSHTLFIHRPLMNSRLLLYMKGDRLLLYWCLLSRNVVPHVIVECVSAAVLCVWNWVSKQSHRDNWLTTQCSYDTQASGPAGSSQWGKWLEDEWRFWLQSFSSLYLLIWKHWRNLLTCNPACKHAETLKFKQMMSAYY